MKHKILSYIFQAMIFVTKYYYLDKIEIPYHSEPAVKSFLFRNTILLLVTLGF